MLVTGYLLVDPRTSVVRYVGITTQDPTYRFALHLQEAKRTGTKSLHKVNWIRSLASAGCSPRLVLAAVFESLHEAATWEKATIADYRAAGLRLTNATDGGEGNQGWDPSKATRQKMREAKLGKPGNHRTPHSVGTRALLRQANLGHKHSLETRRFMSQQIFLAHLKRKLSSDILRAWKEV